MQRLSRMAMSLDAHRRSTTPQAHDLTNRLRGGLRRAPSGEGQLMAILRDGWMLLDQFTNVHYEPTRSADRGMPCTSQRAAPIEGCPAGRDLCAASRQTGVCRLH